MGGCSEAAALGLEGRELGSAVTGGSALSSRKELTAEARELKGELYCLPCHDKMGVPICGACRRPIEGRVVNALGKQWHVEVSEAGVDSRLGGGGGQLMFTAKVWPCCNPSTLPPRTDLPLGCCPSWPLARGGSVHGTQRPEGTEQGQAGTPPPRRPFLPGLLEDAKVLRHPHPSSLSWPSRRFQGHENTLGTLVWGALWDCV